MENIETLEAALKRIAELERENEKLREELEYYKNRKMRVEDSERLSYFKGGTYEKTSIESAYGGYTLLLHGAYDGIGTGSGYDNRAGNDSSGDQSGASK